MGLISAVVTFKVILWMLLNYQVKGAHDCQEVSKKICEQNSSRCYYEMKDSVQHVMLREAKEICSCNKLQLVSPKDAFTMNMLRDNFKYNFWIDLKRTNFDNFAFVQTGKFCPDQIKESNNEDSYLCAYVDVPNGNSHTRTLHAAPCHNRKPSICRLHNVREGLAPFLVQQSELSWYEARRECIAQGGDLIYPKNEENITSVVENIRLHKQQYWIGLHKEEWQWGDGSTLTYSNWDEANGQPSTVTEHCVVSQTHQEATWIDVTCDNNSGVVCVSGSQLIIPVTEQPLEYGPYVEMTATDEPDITTLSTAPPANLFRLSDPVKYALIAICGASGLLILILTIVLICLCCRRRNRRVEVHEDFNRPRAYSTTSKVGVALPTPPGPPARHTLHESMYDTISLEEVQDNGPYIMGSFQRGQSDRSGRSGRESFQNRQNFRQEAGRANGVNGTYTDISRKPQWAGDGLSLTYDTVIAENECYGKSKNSHR